MDIRMAIATKLGELIIKYQDINDIIIELYKFITIDLKFYTCNIKQGWLTETDNYIHIFPVLYLEIYVYNKKEYIVVRNRDTIEISRNMPDYLSKRYPTIKRIKRLTSKHEKTFVD